MIFVVVPTEDRGYMMMVVVPNKVLTSSTEWYLWKLFTLSDFEVHQAYLLCAKRCPGGCLEIGQQFLWTRIIRWEMTIDGSLSPRIYEYLHIYFFEDTTSGCLFPLLFPFLPLTFISYSQSSLCIDPLYTRWGRCPNYNQGSSWWLHNYPISHSFD